MLTDQKIRKISLAAAIFGIIFLFSVSELAKAEQIKIADITQQHLDKKISTIGRIYWCKKTTSTIIFGLEDSVKMNAVIFQPSAEQSLAVDKGAVVLVVGKVTLYKGKLEIIVEKIERLYDD